MTRELDCVTGVTIFLLVLTAFVAVDAESDPRIADAVVIDVFGRRIITGCLTEAAEDVLTTAGVVAVEVVVPVPKTGGRTIGGLADITDNLTGVGVVAVAEVTVVVPMGR